MPTAGYVLSAHVHKLPGRVISSDVSMRRDGPSLRHVCSADAKCVRGMCSVEL